MSPEEMEAYLNTIDIFILFGMLLVLVTVDAVIARFVQKRWIQGSLRIASVCLCIGGYVLFFMGHLVGVGLAMFSQGCIGLWILFRAARRNGNAADQTPNESQKAQ